MKIKVISGMKKQSTIVVLLIVGVETVSCRANQFRCQDKQKCIDKKFLCDHKKDCNDNSDEDVSVCGKCKWCLDFFLFHCIFSINFFKKLFVSVVNVCLYIRI